MAQALVFGCRTRNALRRAVTHHACAIDTQLELIYRVVSIVNERSDPMLVSENLVELIGIEPTTSGLQSRRSPS